LILPTSREFFANLAMQAIAALGANTVTWGAAWDIFSQLSNYGANIFLVEHAKIKFYK